MTHRPSRVVIVANPAAGSRRGGDPVEKVYRAVRGRASVVELVRTRAPGDAASIASASAAEGFDLALVVGGDGTVHEAANGAAGTGMRLGIVPTGTMNLLARVLALPLRPVPAALHAVESRRVRTMRPGRAGDRLFVAMAGIGLDAWVLRELLARSSRKIAFRDYVFGALRGLASYPFPEIEFSHDGRSVTGSVAVLGRAPLYGGFLRPTPRVRVEDAELELCVLEIGGVVGALRLAPYLWSGAHLGRNGVHDRRVTEVQARSSYPDVPVQLDGEPAGRLPASFGVSTRTLNFAC